MGYYTEMRVATTKEGWAHAKERAEEIYCALLQDKLDKAVKVKTHDNGEYVEWNNDGSNGFNSARTSLPKDTFNKCGEAEVTVDGKTKQYVMYGFSWLKWIGYEHMERRAWEMAWEEIEEPVYTIAVGEDGVTEENEYGEDYDMPYIETGGFSYSDEWKLS